MMNGMESPKVKVAITLRPELVEQVRTRVAAGQARSVSAFIEHAVRGQLAAEADFDEMITEMLAATGGPASAKERAAARRLLSGSAA
jgi:Arc/MetJ-type ribon-helix-helix transcriptional regulator